MYIHQYKINELTIVLTARTPTKERKVERFPLINRCKSIAGELQIV